MNKRREARLRDRKAVERATRRAADYPELREGWGYAAKPDTETAGHDKGIYVVLLYYPPPPVEHDLVLVCDECGARVLDSMDEQICEACGLTFGWRDQSLDFPGDRLNVD